MSASQQAFAHMLEVVKGFPDSNIVQATADVSENVSIDVYKGRCVHLNAAGEWEMGATGHQMPYFAQTDSRDSDAKNDGSPDWNGGVPTSTPRVTAIGAKAAVILATTEYDPAQDYAIDDPLRAIASNSDQTTGGRLTNQGVTQAPTTSEASQTAVVGRVHRAPAKRQSDRPAVLMFTPTYEFGATGL